MKILKSVFVASIVSGAFSFSAFASKDDLNQAALKIKYLISAPASSLVVLKKDQKVYMQEVLKRLHYDSSRISYSVAVEKVKSRLEELNQADSAKKLECLYLHEDFFGKLKKIDDIDASVEYVFDGEYPTDRGLFHRKLFESYRCVAVLTAKKDTEIISRKFVTYFSLESDEHGCNENRIQAEFDPNSYIYADVASTRLRYSKSTLPVPIGQYCTYTFYATRD